MTRGMDGTLVAVLVAYIIISGRCLRDWFIDEYIAGGCVMLLAHHNRYLDTANLCAY